MDGTRRQSMHGPDAPCEFPDARAGLTGADRGQAARQTNPGPGWRRPVAARPSAGKVTRNAPPAGNPIAGPPTIDDLLIAARSGLARLEPVVAFRAVWDGAILIDTRPEWQRRADGEIPGVIVIERNHLEWRCDPASPARVPEATGNQVTWIVCCDEGYSSSLAAASLQALGLRSATDLIGGFQAWRAAGLPVAKPGQPSRPRLP